MEERAIGSFIRPFGQGRQVICQYKTDETQHGPMAWVNTKLFTDISFGAGEGLISDIIPPIQKQTNLRVASETKIRSIQSST